jgi:hypothetical protein
LEFGDPDLVEGAGVELDEPLPLLLGDVEASVHVDQVLEPELAAEPVGTTERLCGEGGEMVHVHPHAERHRPGHL